MVAITWRGSPRRDKVGVFLPAPPLASDAGMAALTGRATTPACAATPRRPARVSRCRWRCRTGRAWARSPPTHLPDRRERRFPGNLRTTWCSGASRWTCLGRWLGTCTGINDTGINQINPAGHLVVAGHGEGALGWPIQPGTGRIARCLAVGRGCRGAVAAGRADATAGVPGCSVYPVGAVPISPDGIPVVTSTGVLADSRFFGIYAGDSGPIRGEAFGNTAQSAMLGWIPRHRHGYRAALSRRRHGLCELRGLDRDSAEPTGRRARGACQSPDRDARPGAG